ncbi:DUF1631 domain-containing protein [Chitinimonas lacunae]|uniref:DUF1631 domain-containing protein n=1 Tax=Chitinimonas lacunae TaxID=1963018 RepID=A0ABV8MMM5_9NEIS
MSKPETLAMLSSCRDLAADLLCRSLSSMLDKIEESLFELAEKAGDRDTQNLYLQARGESQAKRAAIEAEFRRQFVAGFNRMTAPGAKGEAKSFDQLDFDNLELSLVGHDDYEENLTVSNIATRLKNSCGEELVALNHRIGSLMQLPESEVGDNPVSPDAIVDAFRAACKQIESDLNVRLLVLKQFEQVAADNVSNVYQNLNQFLIQRNILPVLPKQGYRRRQSGGQRGGGGAAAGLPGGEMGSQIAAAPEVPAYAAGNEQELINTLQQLLALNQAMQGNVAPAGGPAVAGQLPMGMPQIPAAMFASGVGQSFLDALNFLQQGDIEQALTDPGDLDRVALVGGTGNVLHQIKTTSLAHSLGHVDAMTVDIVAMLFDYIFDDKNIPQPMKALIGRLQIPVLKVAMLDTKFFARKTHPTRKLLDTLAVAALGWDESDGTDDRLYQKIAGAVENIVTNFDENLGIFQETLTDLEQFLIEEEQRATAAAEEAAQSLVEAEKRELAEILADESVAQRVLTPELPELIKDFLLRQWQPVLKHIALVQSEQSDNWRLALQAMDDLVWSVAPKVGVEERLKLVNMLPRLLKQLERGTEAVGIERGMREAFFAELVRCHANAIKSGLKSADPAAQAVAAPAPIGAQTTIATPVPAAALASTAAEPPIPRVVAAAAVLAPVAANVAESPLGDAGGLSAFEVNNPNWDAGLDKYQDYDDVVANQLKRGTWIEFIQPNGEASRVKLTWVSPRKSRFLFTNRQGQNGLEFTLVDLVGMFKRGEARLLEGGPLVERAVSDMIDMLQPGNA